jgi:hypothetical protein
VGAADYSSFFMSKRLLEVPAKSYKRIAIVFLVLSFLLLGTIAYFSLARVNIIVVPQSELVVTNFKATVGGSESRGLDQPQDNKIAGEVVTTEVEVSEIFDVKASQTIPAKAEGQVSLINNLSTQQTLVVNTRLLSPAGIIFRLTERQLIPPGGRSLARVIADQPGEQGNIGPARFTIPGLSPARQDLVYAVSASPMTGGLVEAQVTTPEELDTARQLVETLLLEKAKAKLIEDIGGLPDQLSGDNLVVEITQIDLPTEPGQAAAQFSVSGQARAAAVIIAGGDDFTLAYDNLVNITPPHLKLKNHLAETFSASVEQIDWAQNSATLAVHLEGEASVMLDLGSFDKEKLIGMGNEELENYFLEFAGVKETRISFSPFWVTSVPPLKDHIEIIIED